MDLDGTMGVPDGKGASLGPTGRGGAGFFREGFLVKSSLLLLLPTGGGGGFLK